MQNESLGKSFYSLSFNFQKFRIHSCSVNQSHNNQTVNQIYLFNITFQNLEFWDVTTGHQRFVCFPIFDECLADIVFRKRRGSRNLDASRSDSLFGSVFCVACGLLGARCCIGDLVGHVDLHLGDFVVELL